MARAAAAWWLVAPVALWLLGLPGWRTVAAKPGVPAATDFPTMAQSKVMSCCSPDRYDQNVVVVNNNLGGRGPDRYKAPASPNEESLRYSNIPAASGRRGVSRKVDLSITATSAYATERPYKNGLHGSLLQVNIDAGNTVDLELSLRDSMSDERIFAEELVLFVFDLDEDIGKTARTAVSAAGFKESFVSETTELQQATMKDKGTWFLSQNASDLPDGPLVCCDGLSRRQQDKMVAFEYSHVDRISLRVHVSYGRRSHNFLFAVKMCTSCATGFHGVVGGHPVTPQSTQGRMEPISPPSHSWQTILWSVGDMLHLPGSGGGGQPEAGASSQNPATQSGATPSMVTSPTHRWSPAAPVVTGTGGTPPSPPPEGAWRVAGNRACRGSEVMWAWCKGECQSACGGGGGCSAVLESAKQNPVDCSFSAWSAWTPCSATCGTGWHTRMRHIVQPPEFGGHPCKGSLWQMSSCQATACGGRAYMLGHWTAWSGCDAHSPGYRLRTRKVEEALRDGKDLGEDSVPIGPTKQVEECKQISQVNCVISPWAEWEACNRRCGGGQTYRRRNLELLPRHGGKCPASEMLQAKPCNMQDCPELNSCELGMWSLWSDCSSGCPGNRYRSRAIIAKQEDCTVNLKEVAPCHKSECSMVDCRWAEWNSWGACTCTCGGGTKRRTRELADTPRSGGRVCDARDKSEVAECNTQSCTVCVDGAWTVWSTWTSCSSSCGAGFKWRHRDVEKEANDCGKPPTGFLEESATCQGTESSECGNADCLIGSWGAWSACSCSCFGVRERTRAISQFQSGTGKPCTDIPLKTIEPCNPMANEQPAPDCGREAVPVNCKLGAWSVWGQCSVTCGSGQRQRSRHILSPSANHGSSCGNQTLEETRECEMPDCQRGLCVNCVWGPWSEWGSCSKCGGQRYRHRIIQQLPNLCGRRCDARSAREVTSCPSDCEKVYYCAWNEWTPWSECDKECGIAVKSRQRFLGLREEKPDEYLIEVTEANARSMCHGTQRTMALCLPYKPCQNECVPTDCEFAPWTDWVGGLGCAGLCDRRRSIRRMNNECGQPCNGALEETQSCKPTHCNRQDCGFSSWSAWSCPTESCGSSPEVPMQRSRTVLQEPRNGGSPCSGSLIETKAKPEGSHGKPTPCSLDKWSDWSVCTASCGSGWRTRFRSIRTLAMHGGQPCQDTLEQGEHCAPEPCPDDSGGCNVSPWSDWHGCMRSGQQFRSRQLNPMVGKVIPCGSSPGHAFPLDQTRPCENVKLVAVDCAVSQWTEWYACDRTCDGGEQQRDRQVEAYPKNGGHSCPRDMRELRGCNLQACPSPQGACKDGHWEEWSPWSQCSVSCGGGIQWRTRLRAEQANECGRPASGLSRETRHCVSRHSCSKDIDCKLSEWGSWSGCSGTCDGVRHRSRRIEVHGEGHGEWCLGPTKESMACEPCEAAPPVDCLLGEWGSWSDCPVTCGSSEIRRERLVKREARRGGIACEGSLVDIRNCGLQECPSPPPVDCLWGQWGAWGACSQAGGQRNRFRHILRHAQFGGQPCEVGAVEETVGCSRPHYQSYCIWAQWEAWSPCSDWTPCRSWGKRSRIRHLVLGESTDASAINTFYEEAQDGVNSLAKDSRPGSGEKTSGTPWFLTQGMRLEVLTAFICGYFGRVVVAASGASPFRRRAPSTSAEGAVGSARRSLVQAWLGGFSSAAARVGYAPVPQGLQEA